MALVNLESSIEEVQPVVKKKVTKRRQKVVSDSDKNRSAAWTAEEETAL
jgi:hypothetical protein